MRTSRIVLLCILGAALLSSVICSNGVGPDNCCFRFYPRKLNRNLIQAYEVTDQRCSRSGVILVTKRNNRICADPTLSWVDGIMRRLDDASL